MSIHNIHVSMILWMIHHNNYSCCDPLLEFVHCGTLMIVRLFLQLTVIAADLRGLGPPGTVRTTTGVVRVVVLDINDNVPTFIDPVSGI